jgi:CHAT domain-containing protein
MTRFYRNILQEMSRAEALRPAWPSLIAYLRGRQSVKTALEALPIRENPQLWAGFVLEGDP